MSEGIGLRPREMRVLGASCRATLVSTLFAVLFAGPVVGLHWILLAGAVGAVLAWAVLRADRTRRERGVPGSRVRRFLGRVCEWGSVAGLAMLCAAFWVVLEFHLSVPDLIARLEALPDGPMTQAAFFAAMTEALRGTWRQALENAALPIALVGTFGIADALLSGLAYGLLAGAVSARCGVSLWRALYAGAGGGRDWKAFARRERARRRSLLCGEVSV
ncbi:MAG: hypothetical protein OXN81_13025 [Alphaproteobacteria bacterium]|nr:hypothetical protein [Alphaproteobacteria bacterium]